MEIRCKYCFSPYESNYGMCPNCGYVDGEDTGDLCLLPIGTILENRYQIGGKLGFGGFGIIYRAWDIHLSKQLAIKEFYPQGLVNRLPGTCAVLPAAGREMADLEVGKQRFLDEARNMAKFNQHHNIINVFNYFEANDTAYIVMEFLDGVSLRKTLDTSKKPMPVDRCLSVVFDLLDAAEAIHREGILHRDIAPDNIMLCYNGRTKLVDFGAARFASDGTLTSSRTVMIKPGYTPPEQYLSQAVQDPRTDLYAIGATFYEMLTGIKPLESTNRADGDRMPTPRELCPNVPAYISKAVMRAIAIDPHDRFSSLEEFRTVLKRRDGEPGPSRGKVIRTLKYVSIAVLALLLAAGGFLLWYTGSGRSARLPEGSISLWYMAYEDEAYDKAIQEHWNAVIRQFTKQYQNISIEAVPIPMSQYEDRIREAARYDELPEICESTYLPENLLEDAVPLDKLLKDCQGKVLLDALDGENRQLPTSLEVPVIYVNTAIGSVGDTDTFSELIRACEKYGSTLVCSPYSLEFFEDVYADGGDIADYVPDYDDGLNSFLAGECMVYLGASWEYPTVQAGLLQSGNGTYDILFPDTDVCSYAYGNLWSITTEERNPSAIANAFLRYLSSDYCQDRFYIRNFSLTEWMPATHSALDSFLEIYEELEDLTDFLDEPFAD